MDIERKQRTDGIEVRISGRLDAHWSDQLDRELTDVVRGGARLIYLDMAEIAYVSSTGIRILLKYWKDLKAINGVFRVVSPSANVRNVIRMSGMLGLLEEKRVIQARPAPKGTEPEVLRKGGGRFMLFHPYPGARLSLSLIGRPERLARLGYTADDVTVLSLSRDTMALGLGAFGADFDEARSRFGEFLAAGGAAICLPTDGSGRPDDQVAVGEFIPSLRALYAVLCQGAFARFFHFQSDDPGGAPLALSQLVETAFSLCDAPAVGIVLIAETDGLVGATLRQPPLGRGDASPFAFPDVREWLSLTTEPVHPRSLALVAGVAVAGGDPRLAPFVRPLGGAMGLSGHIHAAALSYRALPGGLLDLPKILSDILETQNLQGVLHLLNDSRAISGIGESLFIRGALWAGPLDFPPAEHTAAAGGMQ
jgi:anti-anti-sigma factor